MFEYLITQKTFQLSILILRLIGNKYLLYGKSDSVPVIYLRNMAVAQQTGKIIVFLIFPLTQIPPL